MSRKNLPFSLTEERILQFLENSLSLTGENPLVSRKFPLTHWRETLLFSLNGGGLLGGGLRQEGGGEGCGEAAEGDLMRTLRHSTLFYSKLRTERDFITKIVTNFPKVTSP